MAQVYNKMIESKAKGMAQLAVLLDPDHQDSQDLDYILSLKGENAPDYFFVGGSVLRRGKLSGLLSKMKGKTEVPILIFPGGGSQIDPAADAFLLLSLLSGRNPQYLIGEHVDAAYTLELSNLELIPTGYLLIDGGSVTAVQEVTETEPIARTNLRLTCSTALAGVQLGMKCIYLETGSGAQESVPPQMAKAVAKAVDVPLIVGGGIRSTKTAAELFSAGTNIIVVGTALEENETFLPDLIRIRNTHSY